MYAQVLEWLWLLNSHREVMYKKMHGDKDTYKLAFFLAGKLDQFEQVRECHRTTSYRVELVSSVGSTRAKLQL